MEYLELADLIEKYGKSLVECLYIDNKMSIDEMKAAFEEKDRRKNNFKEALEFIEKK